MHRFFVDRSQVTEDKVFITGGDVNHIKNVLRMKTGDEIQVSDGSNRVRLCRISQMEGEEIEAKILSVEESFAELPAQIYLFQGIPKGDKMEWIIQKAVELGVYAIVPMMTNRVVVKLDKKKEENRLKRWNLIAESAAKQSGRTVIPEVLPVMGFEEVCNNIQEFECKMIPYECAKGMKQTQKLVEGIQPGNRVGILIGPEGGFEKDEVEMALQNGIEAVSLGNRILRTETAGMVVLGVMMFYLESQYGNRPECV